MGSYFEFYVQFTITVCDLILLNTVGYREQVAFFMPPCNPQHSQNLEKSITKLKAVEVKWSK